MAQFPALPLWTDAYLGDTTHLTTIEHGAYLLLLIVAWRSKDGTLPDDDKLLSRYAKLSFSQWQRIKPIIEQFFTIENGKWKQGRLVDELNAVKQLSKSQSKKAKDRWLKNNDSSYATASSGQCNGNASPTPTPTPLKKDNTNVLSKEKNEIDILDLYKKLQVQKQPKGTRLPEDWELPDDWGDWAVEKFKWSVEDVILISQKFKDHWLAKSGKDAVKNNWNATWRNWCRTENEGTFKKQGFKK